MMVGLLLAVTMIACKEENWESLWRLLEGEKPMPSVKKAKTENFPSAEKESPVDILLRLI